MIPRDRLKQLSDIHSPTGCAITFYYQPGTPQNKAHSGEAIFLKDLVQQALRRAEQDGNHQALRGDLRRLMEKSEELHGNHSRGKAIFACAEHQIWEEFDVPALLPKSQLIVNSRFHLKPLAVAANTHPRTCIALTDRAHARFLHFDGTGVTALEEFTSDLPRMGKSDGFGGYDAGHTERHYQNETMRHFKDFADRLKTLQEARQFEHVIIGCRDESWAEIEPHLHTYVRQKLLAHVPLDAQSSSEEEIRDTATRLIEEHREAEHQGLVREIVGEAQRDGRGVTGLRNVLLSLERGEIHKIVMSDGFSARAVQCTNCGHLDSRLAQKCAVCANDNRELEDVADELVSNALRGGVDLVYVRGENELSSLGNIGALLRFRADQNTAQKLAG